MCATVVRTNRLSKTVQALGVNKAHKKEISGVFDLTETERIWNGNKEAGLFLCIRFLRSI